MTKDISLRTKYRAVLQYGMIKRGRQNNHIFVAFPDKGCPIVRAENRSRWDLVNTVYEAIKSYN